MTKRNRNVAVIEICTDIIRGRFNYGYTHTVTFSPHVPSALKAIVDRYSLGHLNRVSRPSGLFFSKTEDLNYSLVIFGDWQPVQEFLANPVEVKSDNSAITVCVDSVSAGDAL